jgi:hypothetical protein
MLLLAIIAIGVSSPPSSAATRLPGLQPSELGRLVINPSDIRALNASLELDTATLLQAHEAMKRYETAVQDGSREVLAALAALEPAEAVAAAAREQERTAWVEQVRDRIEARRRAGEFRDNPGAAREAWQEAMDEAEQEAELARRDTAQIEGWANAFPKQASVLAAWYDTKASLTAALHADLMDLVGASHEAQLNRWWLKSRLEHAMKRGRLSGEQHDPFGVAYERSDASELAREAWQAEHVVLIDRRDAAVQRIPLIAAEAVARGSLRSYKNAVDEAMAARESVRAHATTGAELAALLLDDDAAARYLLAANKQAFPGVWRIDRGVRALDAALQVSTLDQSQRGMVAALRMEHQQLWEELRLRHLDAVRAEEGPQLADQDVQRAMVLFGGEFTPRGTPMLDASSRERQSLSDDTMMRLRGILTDAQWQRIPGTRTEPARD